jgi:uncharacterized protein (DUF488 family)
MKIPTFKRQRILLALLKIFGGKLSKIELQKYMFLFVNEFSDKKYYAFVPYYFGSFSFELYKDISVLEKNNFLKIENNNIELKIDSFPFTIENDNKKLLDFYIQYKYLKGDNLIKYLYENYPYYAINSKIAYKFLNNEFLDRYKPKDNEAVFFTIGYEGKKFEEYLNQLIQNNIKVLVDVRKNPHSMKYGFSKNTLKKTVENLSIQYIHMPNLGIESDKRKNLKTKQDYDNLFEKYKQNLLYKEDELKKLYDIFKQNKRIAITCFEKDVNYCHRKIIADKINYFYNVKVSHL